MHVYMYVCMYVCVYIYMCVCVCVCMYAYAPAAGELKHSRSSDGQGMHVSLSGIQCFSKHIHTNF